MLKCEYEALQLMLSGHKYTNIQYMASLNHSLDLHYKTNAGNNKIILFDKQKPRKKNNMGTIISEHLCVLKTDVLEHFAICFFLVFLSVFNILNKVGL